MIDQRRDDYSRARIGAAQTATSAFGIPLAVQPNVRSSSRPIESRLTAYGQFTPSPVFARHGAIAGSSCSIALEFRSRQDRPPSPKESPVSATTILWGQLQLGSATCRQGGGAHGVLWVVAASLKKHYHQELI